MHTKSRDGNAAKKATTEEVTGNPEEGTSTPALHVRIGRRGSNISSSRRTGRDVTHERAASPAHSGHGNRTSSVAASAESSAMLTNQVTTAPYGHSGQCLPEPSSHTGAGPGLGNLQRRSTFGTTGRGRRGFHGFQCILDVVLPFGLRSAPGSSIFISSLLHHVWIPLLGHPHYMTKPAELHLLNL
jgi:hypothetical protein